MNSSVLKRGHPLSSWLTSNRSMVNMPHSKRFTMPSVGCICFKLLVHHERVHKPMPGMAESPWQGADYIEPEPLPEADRTLIRGKHQVVLHGPKTSGHRLALRMFTHCGRNA